MLERLEVTNLGIIESLVLEPARGLLAVTGETGAGKSLLIGSLKLLAGERAQADMVRSGEDLLRVEGWFSGVETPALLSVLDELGLPSADGLALRREVTAKGRSRAWVNDVAVRAATLQRIASGLLAIHGQHEQYGLADPKVQRELVDLHGGHEKLLARVRRSYEAWREAAAEAGRLREARSRRQDRLDAIAFQLGEIDAADPQPGEDAKLEARREVLRHAVRLLELGASLTSGLGEGEHAVLDRLARAEREVEEMAACGVQIAEAGSDLARAQVYVEEVLGEVQAQVARIEEQPDELDSVEMRLQTLERLMRKYGSPVEAVLERREELVRERAELMSVEERLESAEGAARAALEAYDNEARALDASRHESASGLTGEAEQVLDRLNMQGTRMELRWEAAPDERSPLRRDGRGVSFGAGGVEECELFIAPNPGEEPRPLARIASGGELSRIHLALRKVLRDRWRAAGITLLFDEVDQGLGGSTAAALGGLLARRSSRAGDRPRVWNRSRARRGSRSWLECWPEGSAAARPWSTPARCWREDEPIAAQGGRARWRRRSGRQADGGHRGRRTRSHRDLLRSGRGPCQRDGDSSHLRDEDEA